MIYVFRRRGFVVPLVPIFSALFLAILKEESGFYSGSSFLEDILFVSFSILLPLGLKWNLHLELNEKTHTFYWLRIEIWASIFLLLGLFFKFN